MPYASVTDFVLNPIVEVATEFISSAGLPAVFLLMALESACIPIPSEAIMLFAGFAVSKGELTMVGIVAAGVLGNLVGSLVGYAIGYFGRTDCSNATASSTSARSGCARSRAGSSATARPPSSSPGCCRWSAPSSRSRPGWRGCRSAASRLLTVLGSLPWVLALALLGKGVGAELGRLAPPPLLPRLRDRRRDRDRDRLVAGPPPLAGGGDAAARPRASSGRAR